MQSFARTRNVQGVSFLSRDSVAIFETGPESFLVTMDEAFVHHFQPAVKEQLKQWKNPGSPPPRIVTGEDREYSA